MDIFFVKKSILPTVEAVYADAGKHMIKNADLIIISIYWRLIVHLQERRRKITVYLPSTGKGYKIDIWVAERKQDICSIFFPILQYDLKILLSNGWFIDESYLILMVADLTVYHRKFWTDGIKATYLLYMPGLPVQIDRGPANATIAHRCHSRAGRSVTRGCFMERVEECLEVGESRHI